MLVVLVAARLMLPSVIRWYVNRVLDSSVVYEGRIGAVEVHLWRGAYAIRDVQINKTTGNVPVPLLSARRVDLAVQWDAIIHGKIVGVVTIEEPQLNFVDAPDKAEAQTGAEGPWLEILRDLFPFKINSARVQNGSIHFRTYQKAEPVDIYLSQLDASVDNLTNIRDEITPLVTTVHATALAMDQAAFEYNMRLDPFSYRPTFHMAVRLLGLDVTKLNNFALAYGQFDFKRGWFDLVMEVDAKEGQMSGYIKPLFRDLKVFSLTQDLKEDNVLQVFWQAVVGLTTGVLKNQPRDQFGTLIPFTGDLSDPSFNIFQVVGNILRNAFVRAYLPRLEPGTQVEGLTFGPATLADPISAGDEQ